jgi:hypothetical protein
MNCDRAIPLLPLAVYGELGDGERHELESHLAECPSCASEWDEVRRLQTLLAPAPTGSPKTGEEDRLLTQWRANLSALLDGESALPAPPADHAPSAGTARWRTGKAPWQPFYWSLPLLLLAAGFAAGWVSHRPPARQAAPPVTNAAVTAPAPVESAEPVPARPLQTESRPLNPDAVLRINSVERVPDGDVRIHFDTVAEHAVTGRSNDPRIRQILLYAALQPPNSGVRLDSLDMLQDQTQDRQVRQVLMRVLLHDPNPGVRLKALESLSPQVNSNAVVRQAIMHAVLHDANAGVRSQAVGALSQAPPREAAPLLRRAGNQTGNLYLRLRIAAALRQMQENVPPQWLNARASPAVTAQ